MRIKIHENQVVLTVTSCNRKPGRQRLCIEFPADDDYRKRVRSAVAFFLKPDKETTENESEREGQR